MGTLYVVATPIGNLEDITIRAIKTLFSVDIIACEDTRRTGQLLQELRRRYSIVLQQFSNLTIPQFIRYDGHTEKQITPQLIQDLTSGASIALVSDAGTPLISDPGYVLVLEARKHGIPVVSIPGPSAVLTALTSSGLPVNNFVFLGYPPEKKSNRIKLFQNLLQINTLIDSTFILYCAPHKLIQTLRDMQDVLGNIEITIARELTKIHEEILRGKISEALLHFTEPRGEVVLLFNLSR